MGKISVGEVVLVRFPFSDLSSKKLRPCLVIGLAEFGDVIVCQITSQVYGSNRAISLTAKDFSSGSLVIDSFIRPDKIATLDTTIIQKNLGKITTVKLTEAQRILKEVLEF